MAIYLYDGKILTEGNAIAIHEDCCCAPSNYQWKRCDNDADAAVLSAGHTDVDFAWLCLSSIWVKCYNDALKFAVATDPTVLKQCDDAAPSSCLDLVGWPASDDFGGTGCNSGAISDQNWIARGYSTSGFGSGSISYVSNALRVETTATGSDATLNQVAGSMSHTGAFTLTAPFTNFVKAGGSTDHISYFRLYYSDGTWDGCLFFISGSNSGLVRLNKATGGSIESTGTPSSSGTVTISRDGSNNIQATLWGVTLNYTGHAKTVDHIQLITSTSSAYGPIDWSSFTLVDGSGSNIYIDPSGKSCT